MFPNSAATISLNLKQNFNTRIALFSTTDFFNTHSTLKALARNPVISPNYYLRHDRISYDVRSFACRLVAFRDALIEQISIGLLGDRIIRRGARRIGLNNGFVELFSVIESFTEALNSLHDYRIIWSIGAKVTQGLKTHIKTVAWAPQSAILQDNRTKLFFTHGGLKSIKEAICAGVPMLTIPFIADQMKNSLLAYQAGIAEIIHKRRITSAILLKAMHKILQDNNYRQKIVSMRSIYNDRIMVPIQLETFWVERILRSKRSEIAFRIRATQMSWISYSANILFINMYNSKSHALSMMPLAKSLANRGNRVAMFSIMVNSMNELDGGVENIEARMPIEKVQQSLTILGSVVWEWDFQPYRLSRAYTQAELYFSVSVGSEALNKTLNTPWDVIIADDMFPVASTAISLYCKQRYNTRIALFSTTELFGFHSSLRALSRNPVTEPNYYISLDDLDEDWQSFMSRLKTVRDLIIEWFSMGVLGAKTLQNGIRMIGVDEQLSDLVAPVQHFNYKCVAILPADLRRKKPVRSEGAEDFPIVDAKPLPEDVEKFVSSPNSRGTIYVAFGSMADWSNAPSHVIKSFVEAFNALDAYRIIWSSKAKPPEGLKDHIKILSWAPQSSILLHKRTKLFFTHAGLKSIRESICAKVPMLAIPFFADQAKNAYLCRAAGFARIIHKRKVNASVLLESIEDMLNNGSYQRRISKVNKLCMESILAPLRKETFWVERILRSKAPYVTYPIKGAQMPLMQYFGLDIASFLVVIIIVLLK
ncbi:unnamed protein product [Toxocara canis]|uniref:glucuronosyltransferase n=1 Tax=Toxocara canis TaxID=6265 RepID=A0A183V589_TOXCA|nr:unnamed protein product [Toxocara canis]